MTLAKASWLTDMDGNQIERWEDLSVHPPAVEIRVMLSDRTRRTADQIIAWYWDRVGVIAAAPEDPANVCLIME